MGHVDRTRSDIFGFTDLKEGNGGKDGKVAPMEAKKMWLVR